MSVEISHGIRLSLPDRIIEGTHRPDEVMFALEGPGSQLLEVPAESAVEVFRALYEWVQKEREVPDDRPE